MGSIEQRGGGGTLFSGEVFGDRRQAWPVWASAWGTAGVGGGGVGYDFANFSYRMECFRLSAFVAFTTFLGRTYVRSALPRFVRL